MKLEGTLAHTLKFSVPGRPASLWHNPACNPHPSAAPPCARKRFGVVSGRLSALIAQPRLFLQITALLLSSVTCSSAEPNVVLIVVDDLGWHDLVCMGAPDLHTPNIDSLATNGVKFTNAYVTSPVCSPSRAAILTGRYQQRFGHETNPGTSLEHSDAFGLPLTETTLGNRLKSLDYATGWVGKSHLGWKPQYRPNQRGFDYYFGFLESHHDYLNASASPKWDHDPIRENDMPVTLSPSTYLSHAFASKAVEFIDTHKAEPFFLYVPFNGIHFDLLSTPNLQTRASTLPIDDVNDPLRRTMAEVLLGVDDAVGVILAKLAIEGLASNTLVILTSDNGGDTSSKNAAHNLPLRGGKTQVYEGGIRVPLLMRWPDRIPAGSVYHQPVSTLDILPTCIAATGRTIPKAWQIDGVDLLPHVTGQNENPPHPMLFWRVETDGQPQSEEVFDGLRAVRWGNWKLVKPGSGATWELYDFSTLNGLKELENLADTRADILDYMIGKYDAWAAEMARPRWAVDDLDYPTPEHLLEDIPITGVTLPDDKGNPHPVPGTSDEVIISDSQIARQSGATVTVISTDGGVKTDPWAIIAPEFGGELCYAAIVEHAAVGIYRSVGGIYSRIATLSLPAGTPPRYLYAMRPVAGLRGFNGVSWFTCSAFSNDDPLNPGTTEVWLLGLGPDMNHRTARRIDEPGGTDHFRPQTIVSGGEVLCYYQRLGGQVRLANTGLVLPDHQPASGFARMSFSQGFTASPTGISHATETTHLAVYEGKLFAGLGSTGTNPLGGAWAGAQILVKAGATDSWMEETMLGAHERVQVLETVLFTKEGSASLGASPVNLLIGAFADITGAGGNLVGTRTRMGAGVWQHSEINELAGPAEPISIGSHLNQSIEPSVQNIFVGLSNGEIHQGEYRSTAPGKILWTTAEYSGSGAVTGFAAANGKLHASMNGIYARDDLTQLWSSVYQPLAAQGGISSLTRVDDPRGTANDVLVFTRAWPGVIERLDPANGNTVVVELDVRDFLARKLQDDSLRVADLRIGYTAFSKAVDPVNGEKVQLIGLWLNAPGAGTLFLVRHHNATYEFAGFNIGDLRAVRCIAASPFAGQAGFYIGGYDVNGLAATNTAWITNAAWTVWPQLEIENDAPYLQLTWPVTSPDWILETSEALSNWEPFPNRPTVSTTGSSQALVPVNPQGFFRLRKP